MSDKLQIEGKEISIRQVNEKDYISLTDIAKQRNSSTSDNIIRSWLGNRDTEDFLELWESLHNPDFNPIQMNGFKDFRQREKRQASIKEYIEKTGAIGIISKSGRYGGTFAHSDIAFEFASWLSPVFKLRMITEYQRLKSDEYKLNRLQWDTGRFLSKINHDIHTDAIKTNIISRTGKADAPYIYASEVDLLNLVVFGITAKQWREQNPNAKGNIRDGASLIQLIILANLETHNAEYITAGASKEARYLRLCEIAARQLEIFKQDKRLTGGKGFIE